MGAYRLSTAVCNAVVDAVVDSVDGGSPGTIKVYTGSSPATPDTTATGTLLVTFTLGNPAFGAASSRVAALNSVASATAAATGTAGWFRAATSGGTAKFDGDVGTSGEELTLNTTAIVSGASVSISSGSMTGPA